MSEAPYLLKKLSLKHSEMADIVYRGQKIGIVIRLEVGFEKGLSIKVHLVLICVYEHSLGIFSYGLKYLIKSFMGKLIVMVAKSYEISRGRL